MLHLKPSPIKASGHKSRPAQHGLCLQRHRTPRRAPTSAPQRQCPTPTAPAATGSNGGDSSTSDVVVIGAGIVGLFVAQELLKHNLSVTLVERKGLCAGATGAGQGYLWMAHRTPGNVAWTLAARSVALWKRMIEQDDALKGAVEWQSCGSLLVSTSAAESELLRERQLALNDMGLKATFADARRLEALEPALAVPVEGGGLLVPADAQINGRAAAHVLLERCKASPHFCVRMDSEVEGLELNAAPGAGEAGHVVQLAGGRLTARKALVVAAGVWTGGILSAATGDRSWAGLLQPRRGHLLELPQPAGMQRVVHGMMEMSYTKHYASEAASSHAPSSASPTDITFTATTSASGSLLIGSSREFGGWDNAPSPAIVSAIMQRAAQFLPGLAPAAAAAAAHAKAGAAGGSSDGGAAGGALEGLSVRVGLRPYAVGGLPMVGPIDGVPGLFVAAGHEGSGLCMGPATGQLLSRHVRKHVSASAPPAAAAGGGSDSLDTKSFEELLPRVRKAEAMA